MKPWEKYQAQTQEEGPWIKYQAQTAKSSEFPDPSTPADGQVKTISGDPLSPDKSMLQQAGDYGQAAIAGANRLAPSLLGMAVDTGVNVRNLGAAGYGYLKNKLTGSTDTPEMIDPSTQFGGSASFQRGMTNVTQGAGGGDPFALQDPNDRTQQNIAMGGTILASGMINPASGVKQIAGNVGKMGVPAAGAITGREIANEVAPGNQTAEAIGTIGGMVGGVAAQTAKNALIEKSGLGGYFSKDRARAIAERQIRGDLKKEGITRPDQLMDDMGPQATGADIGKRVSARAELIAQLPGPGQEAAKFYTARNMQAGERLGQAIDNSVQGGRVDLSNSVKSVIEFNKNMASPLFKRAYAEFPVIKNTHDMQAIQASPMVQDAMQMVNNTRNALGDMPPLNPNKLSLQDWHSIRQELDKIAFGRVTTTPMGKPIGDASIAKILRGRIKDKLTEVTGGKDGSFAKANQYYADDASALNGFEEGLKFESMRAAEINAYMKEHTRAQTDAFRLGGLQKVYNEALATTDSGSAYVKTFNNAGKRQKVEQLLQNKGAYDDILKAARIEKTFNQTMGNLTQGSQTFKRQMLAEEQGVNQEALGSLARGKPVTAAVQVGLKLVAKMRISENQRTEIANILMTPGHAARARLLEIVKNQPKPGADRTLSQLIAIQAAAK